MIDVFRAAKDAAFALTLRCHQYDSVASQREEIFIRSVVGKTAIAEGLALRINSGDIPDLLKDKRIVALDLAGLVARSLARA